MLIRRGRRVADYLHADCTALFVHGTPELSQLPAEERQAVEKHLRFARSLQIETRILGGSSSAFWNGCVGGISPRTSSASRKTFKSRSSPIAAAGRILDRLSLRHDTGRPEIPCCAGASYLKNCRWRRRGRCFCVCGRARCRYFPTKRFAVTLDCVSFLTSNSPFLSLSSISNSASINFM